MLRTDEIPREDWPTFFRSFVELHQGRVCTLGVIGDEPDQQVSMHSLRLSALERDTRDGDGICVLVADFFGAKLAHVIAAPRRVYLHQAVEDVTETLEIDGAGGKTVMRFEAPS